MRCLHLASLNLINLILLHSLGSVNSNPHRFHDRIMVICMYLQHLGLIVSFRVEHIYSQNMQILSFNSHFFFLSKIAFTVKLFSLKIRQVTMENSMEVP